MELTGITKRHLYKGLYLPRVFEIMVNHGCNNMTWAGWGDDKTHLLEQYVNPKSVGLNSPASYIDVSLLFNYRTGRFEKYSLTDALSYFDMEFMGRKHRADDDSYNTALLLLKLLE